VAGHNAIVVKVRDGQVANRPFYAALGVTVDGRKEVLGRHRWGGCEVLDELTGSGAQYFSQNSAYVPGTAGAGDRFGCF
jgi:hypothetical protein